LKEIRLHGRGGQGVVVGAEILASAFISEGKYASVLPMFGVERRGAPVTAFLRLDDKPIRERTGIYTPDCLVIFDPVLENQPSVFVGLRERSISVLNTTKALEEGLHRSLILVGAIDATQIALEEIGVPIPNTVIAGAFAATTGWLILDSILASLEDFFEDKLLEGNIRCVKRGFHEVKVLKFGEASSAIQDQV
jgi:2-oxoacid:acceptor oxidoreductase gamma subunit (pyruvate/2-ketoisovalerate family)